MTRRSLPGINLAGATVRTVNLPTLVVAPVEPATPGLIVAFTIAGYPRPWQPARVAESRAFSLPLMRAWERRVADEARLAMGGRPPVAGPIRLELEFRFRRHGGRGDLTNLIKAAEDGLQGVVFANDRDVAGIAAKVREGEAADSMEVRAWSIGEDEAGVARRRKRNVAAERRRAAKAKRAAG